MEGSSPIDLNFKEQDRLLPIANVSRIMKRALPENSKIAKEAKECMQECVSEFIAFITSEATEKCVQDKRKTINDILWAMQSLGFDNYFQVMKIYLQKYKDQNKDLRNSKEDQGNELDDHLSPIYYQQFPLIDRHLHE